MEFDLFYLFFCLIVPSLFLGVLVFLYKRPNKLPKNKPIKLVLWNLMILTFLVSIIFTTGETYYRFYVDTTDSFALNKISQRWNKRHFKLNNKDVRDNINYRTVKAKNKTIRISILGDSFSTGHGVKDVNDRFSNILRARYKKLEIHNFSFNGMNTSMQVRLLEKLKSTDYSTDVFLLAFCLNDVDQNIPQAKQIYNDVKRFNSGLSYFEKNSYFINTMAFRAYAQITPECKNYGQFVLEGYEGEAWKKQMKLFKEVQQLSKEMNTKLAVVTFPFLQKPYNEYQFKKAHAKLSAYWHANQVPHLDLLETYKPYLGESLTVNEFDAHPNEFAHQLAASAIESFLHQIK